jgi:hypothetical protein
MRAETAQTVFFEKNEKGKLRRHKSLGGLDNNEDRWWGRPAQTAWLAVIRLELSWLI